MAKNNSNTSLSNVKLSAPTRKIVDTLLANVEPEYVNLAISGLMMILAAHDGGKLEDMPEVAKDYMAVYRYGHKMGWSEGREELLKAMVERIKDIE